MSTSSSMETPFSGRAGLPRGRWPCGPGESGAQEGKPGEAPAGKGHGRTGAHPLENGRPRGALREGAPQATYPGFKVASEEGYRGGVMRRVVLVVVSLAAVFAACRTTQPPGTEN